MRHKIPFLQNQAIQASSGDWSIPRAAGPQYVRAQGSLQASHPVRPGFSASTDDYGGHDSNERRQRGSRKRGKDPFRSLEENYILLQEALLADGGKLANADLGDINLVLYSSQETPAGGNRPDPATFVKISTSSLEFAGVRGRAISVGKPGKTRNTIRASRALEKPSPRRAPAHHSGPR